MLRGVDMVEGRKEDDHRTLITGDIFLSYKLGMRIENKI
jgi:hypothetical protein